MDQATLAIRASRTMTVRIFLVLLATTAPALAAQGLEQPPNTWVKRSPLPGGPVSPRMGYEASWGYDPRAKVLIRWAGHNQGGGGEQNAETWTFDPVTAKWTLKETNDSPPGVCCAQQNVFDEAGNRFIRFGAFSGNHGWQWFREIYLKNSSVWSYDLATNTWRDMRPLPQPQTNPLRCASWDSDHRVIVVFGGEGNREGTLVYDPYANTWKRQKPPVEPEFRSGGNMAYDSARKRHILFGSQFSDDSHTWAYDLAANRWTDLKPKEQPPTDKNDAVLTYDPHAKVVLAVVKISTGDDEKEKHRLETWAFEGDANTWRKMNPPREPDASGNRARLLTFLPDHGVAILETRTHPPQGPAEQQIWTYRYSDAKPAEQSAAPAARREPPIVEEVVASVLGANNIEVSWKPPPGENIGGYFVERAAVEVWTEDQLRRLKGQTPPLVKPSVGALRRIGGFARLNEKPLAESKFKDTVDLSKPSTVEGEPLYENRMSSEQVDSNGQGYRFAVFAYRVRAVDGSGVESGPSPFVLTIPSAPQSVFSRERGMQCDLKWAKNPEQRIAGYRIYRMNGRWDKDPIVRLNDEPVAETAFSDLRAGDDTRRYHVVAVDALGQEGIPSAPVWFDREWKSFYKPFTGEWHQ
jgi:hypothetical protein